MIGQVRWESRLPGGVSKLTGGQVGAISHGARWRVWGRAGGADAGCHVAAKCRSRAPGASRTTVSYQLWMFWPAPFPKLARPYDLTEGDRKLDRELDRRSLWVAAVQSVNIVHVWGGGFDWMRAAGRASIPVAMPSTPSTTPFDLALHGTLNGVPAALELTGAVTPGELRFDVQPSCPVPLVATSRSSRSPPSTCRCWSPRVPLSSKRTPRGAAGSTWPYAAREARSLEGWSWQSRRSSRAGSWQCGCS